MREIIENMDEKLERIIEILKEYTDPEAGEIGRDTQLIADLGIDSLSFFSVIEFLEDEYDVEITDSQLMGLRTVGDMVGLIA